VIGNGPMDARPALTGLPSQRKSCKIGIRRAGVDLLWTGDPGVSEDIGKSVSKLWRECSSRRRTGQSNAQAEIVRLKLPSDNQPVISGLAIVCSSPSLRIVAADGKRIAGFNWICLRGQCS
jgi:hypothetical protein